MAIISEKEMEIIMKIVKGFSSLSDFDKGYFLGVVESKVEAKREVEGRTSQNVGTLAVTKGTAVERR